MFLTRQIIDNKIDFDQEVEMSVQFTYWKDSDFYIGHLNDYPDYETQGRTLKELQDNLRELYQDIKSEEIPYIQR